MRPAVSVLLPIYRPRHDYLLNAIKSILCQTFADFELLLIEAPSKVPSEEVLQQVQDSRLRHLSFRGPASLVDQLNFGLREAQASLIARMDGDDWSYPERLQKQHDYLLAHPHITVLGTQISIMDTNDHPLGYRCYPTEPASVSKALKRSNVLAHPSVMYRRELVLAAGGYWYRDYPANEDYELWCRLNRYGHQLANLDETLLRYRIHPGAMKSEKLKNILRGTRLVKRHYYGDTMNAGEWARYSAEGALLNLPGWAILKIFQRLQYRQEST
jgi:glycosyltransferase involved in cell wall biosynthesis